MINIFSRKNKNFLFVVLVMVLTLASTFYIVASSKIYVISAHSVSMTERNYIGFGESIRFEFNKSYDEYIAFNMSSNTTFELTFSSANGENSNKLIVNSGDWATYQQDDYKPMLQLVPSYIQKEGYSSITITPIRGEDGNYFVEDFQLVELDKVEKLSEYNTIDFEIKQYEITIKDEDYQVILDDRKYGLELGILHTDDDSIVSAKIKADGENYSADIRLKGDWTDHLVSDQWSYRIELSGDYCIYGLQKFSLQPVATRNGIWEYLIYEMYRDAGGVALRYDFADVYVNGVYLGVFAVEEFMEKRVIENSLNREGPIIKYNETQMWERWSYYNKLIAPIREYEVFSQKKTTQSENLDGYASYAITLMNKFIYEDEPVENVFDVEKYIKLYTILDLFTSYHGRAEHNMRHYYNPVTARLEPIPFDEGSNIGDTEIINNTDIYSAEQFLIYDIITANEEYKQLTAQYLIEFAQNYGEFVEKYQQQVNNFTTTIQRDDPDFAMNIWSIQPKIEQILALTQVQGLEASCYYKDSEYFIELYNPNQCGVKVYSIQSKGSDLADDFTIAKEDSFTLAVDSKLTEVDVLFETSYSEQVEDTVQVEFVQIEEDEPDVVDETDESDESEEE